MKELITIQVGQCGNQSTAMQSFPATMRLFLLVGNEFWKQICHEHGIQQDGTLDPNAAVRAGQEDIFFYQSDNNHYIPRAIMVDLEPRVLFVLAIY